jgi:hypothetical protein
MMERARGLSRRLFGRWLAGAALAPFCGKAAPKEAPRLVWREGGAASVRLERYYHANAQVLLFGLSLIHRERVGGGSVLWREFEGPHPARLLEFGGYSSPERAAGLNRLGFIRELARVNADTAECIYFGLMTSSPEESAEEARTALHSNKVEQTYTAIDGRIGAGATETAIAHFTAPAAVSGERAPELVERARRALASAEKVATADPACGSSHSFLQALAELLPNPAREETRYIYSGRIYQMRLSRLVDRKATEYFRQRRLLADSAQAIRVAGRVRPISGGRETEFRIWIASGDDRPLPLRIEFQPKSYLRLTFEAA